MQAQGGSLVKHYRHMAFMGFLEVLLNARTIARNGKLCTNDILSYKPDVLILVDYSGFNLRIAKFARKAGIKVFYYIAPKVWAWNTKRVKKIRRDVDKLFIIFPFEEEFFTKHGVDVVYEGNPTLDAISTKMGGSTSLEDFTHTNSLPSKPIVALVAGSRKQEVKHNLPVMLKVISRLPEYQFVIAGAPSLTPDFYAKYTRGHNVAIVFNQTYSLMKCSTMAFVTSGTATLEAALLNVPQVVCYKGNIVSMLIAGAVMKVKYISLVNLNMQKETVRELIQFNLTPDKLFAEAQKLLPGTSTREAMLADYATLHQMLGNEGASIRVGARMVAELKKDF